LMLIAKHYSGRFGVWLISLGLISLLACVLWTRTNESAAFYLIPFRAWELLIGSVLALQLIPTLSGSAARNALSLVGLSMMLTSVFVYTHDTPFPGAAAILPTLGTAFVIHAGAGGKTFVNRALSVRPMVFIGLISYSLYLWHWPIVVFAKQYLINEWTDLETSVILIVIILLSTLSWRFVETPFRNRRLFGPRERLFARFAVVTVFVVSGSLAMVFAKGFPGRDTVASMSDVITTDPGWQHWKNCEEAGEKEGGTSDLCSIGAQDVPPTFLFWGDSHALSLASAVNLSADRQGRAGLLAVRTGCPPLLSINRPGERSCSEFNAAILEHVGGRPEINTVILAARWAFASNGTRYKNESGRSMSLIDLESDEAEAGDNVVLFEIGLRRTIKALAEQGKNIVLVTQVPEVGHDVPSATYSAKLTGRDVNAMIAPSIAEYRERTADVARVFDLLVSERPVTIVNPAKLLCDGSSCKVVLDGTPLYRDDNHLSLRGCVLVSDLFDAVIGINKYSQ
ncbi:MAG: hypothetical protein GWP02_08870, partial [Desulfobulbaceae bacterium]|nr:hypothetical protein [Desulfobulbaceae bacterium]